MEIVLGFHETLNIHRRFTELCIGTLSLFNTAVTILTGGWLMYLRPKPEKRNRFDINIKTLYSSPQMVSKLNDNLNFGLRYFVE